MYCAYCGKEIPDGSDFCKYCGRNQKNGAGAADRREKVTSPQVQSKPAAKKKLPLVIGSGVLLLIVIAGAAVFLIKGGKNKAASDIQKNEMTTEASGLNQKTETPGTDQGK